MVFPTKGRDILEKGKPDADKRQGSGVSRPRPGPGIVDYLAGEAGNFRSDLSPFLPQELIGGSVPHVPGTEDEAVWNAAAQACGTEKVHYTYTVDEGKCWYLACPSLALASAPDSWCPLAAALPGNSEYWDRETVYLYEQEGMASALRWDPDTGRMQVFLGAARTLLPRIQSMDANFVTVNPDAAQTVRWKNRMLRTEKLSRAASWTLLLVGIVINLVILFFLAGQHFATGLVTQDLTKVKQETRRASDQLVFNAYNALQSDTIRHMVRIHELLDRLEAIDGTLVKYEVDGNRVVWEALIEPVYSQGVSDLKAKVLTGEKEADGRVRIQGSQ